MDRHLPLVRLGDVAQIRHGWPFRSTLFSTELSGRPIVVSIGNFDYSGGFRFDATPVKEYRGDYPRAYELAPRDVLVVMTCQTPGGEILGVPARVPDDGRMYLHNQRIGKVVVTDPSRVDANYLYWVFLSPALNGHLVRTASGTKILHTAPSRIESFEFRLPPLREQRRITGILDALDDKIQTNRALASTHRRMARTLFASWMQEQEASGAPGGEISAVADVNPESWPARGRPRALRYVDLGVTSADRIDAVLDVRDGAVPSRAQRVLRPGDTIVGTVRPGNRAYALIYQEGLTGSTGFAQIRPHNVRDAALVYLATTSDENIQRLARLADGAAYPAVRPAVVVGAKIPVASRPALEWLSRHAQPLLDRAAVADAEAVTLASIRDALLPRLLDASVDRRLALAR